MDEESLSSVDQFLRDNGFRISNSMSRPASLSGDEQLINELLLIDADIRRTPDPPRFVLLEDEDLLLARGCTRRSGDTTNERGEEIEATGSHYHQNDSLDRSMLYGGSESSRVSDTSPISDIRPLSAASSSSMINLQFSDNSRTSLFESRYQMTSPEQIKPADLVSAASSTSLPPSLVHSGSYRLSSSCLDDELSIALGVQTSCIGSDKLSMSTPETHEPNLVEEIKVDHHSWSLSSPRILLHDKLSRNHDDVSVDLKSCDMSTDLSQSKKAKNENDGQDHILSTSCTHFDAIERNHNIWNGLSDLLRQNGLPIVKFCCLESGEMIPDKESLYQLIHDVVVQLNEKNETIQEMILTSKRTLKVQSRLEIESQSLAKQKEDTLRALQIAKTDIQRLKAMQKKERESAEVSSKQLKTSCLRLQHQLKVSEHRVQAKEVLVQRMQEKLQPHFHQNQLHTTRDRRIFQTHFDREPRRSKTQDMQTLELIRMYETQQDQFDVEMDHLRAQLDALTNELRDLNNTIARQPLAARPNESLMWEQDTTHNSNYAVHSFDDMLVEQLEAARQEQEIIATQLRDREAQRIQKMATMEQNLVTALERIQELEHEKTHGIQNATSRFKCHRNDCIPLVESQTKANPSQTQQYGAFTQWDTLSRETMLQVVKYVCELLHVTDITLVPSSLEKLCRVVAAVPRMETFIRAVCTCVGYESKEDRRGQNVTRFKLKDVLLTLEQWQRAHEKRQELTRFKTLILAKLCQRTRKCTVLDTHDNCNHDLNAFSLTLSCAIQCVSELVEFEKRVLCDNTISTRILAEIKCQPDVWIHPILKHFAHLFQVSTIHEVLPKMNEIYVQVNETKTFVRTICNLLHLKENASFVECLHDLKERLKGNDCNEMETRDLDNGKGLNFVVEKRKGTTSNTDTLDIVGVRQVRQMSLLVRELKHELGAATIDEILPRIQHLMELCCRSIHSNDLEDANR